MNFLTAVLICMAMAPYDRLDFVEMYPDPDNFSWQADWPTVCIHVCDEYEQEHGDAYDEVRSEIWIGCLHACTERMAYAKNVEWAGGCLEDSL